MDFFQQYFPNWSTAMITFVGLGTISSVVLTLQMILSEGTWTVPTWTSTWM